jgi:SAM-dependent methyltransferase
MSASNVESFAGSIPELYDELLVPLIFEPYALDLARRLSDEAISRILEIACGTGAVTRAMAATLDDNVDIVATDVSAGMLEHAASTCPAANVTWQLADALALPFADESFDAVVCQFSVMFFADKPKAYGEVWRVLKPGGRFLFNVWDSIAHNEFSDTVTSALAQAYADQPPLFLARTPHGHFDVDVITGDLRDGGFSGDVSSETISHRSRASSASVPAVAYCQGTPLRNEIEQIRGTDIETATAVAAAALTEKFGDGAVDGKIQAHVFTACK